MSFKEQTTATDSKLMDLLWGKDKVRSVRNEQVRRLSFSGRARTYDWLTDSINTLAFNALQFDKPKSIASKRLERKQRQLIEADESSDEVRAGEEN